jgi:hypothetical protein
MWCFSKLTEENKTDRAGIDRQNIDTALYVLVMYGFILYLGRCSVRTAQLLVVSFVIEVEGRCGVRRLAWVDAIFFVRSAAFTLKNFEASCTVYLLLCIYRSVV